MANQPLDPEGLMKLPGFHQVMVSDARRTIHVAGQVACDADMKLVGIGDHGAQAAKALQNVALALAAANASPSDVVSSTLFIKGLNRDVSQQVMQAMSQALDGQPFPAHAFSLIGVESLASPEILIEITAIAMTDA